MAFAPFVSFPTNRFAFGTANPEGLVPRPFASPTPLKARVCRCGRPLDVFGSHRSACAVVGTLGRRGFPLENAAVRICREAGGRVRINVFVRHLDLGVGCGRRIAPLPRCANSNRTTLVCLLTREGVTQPRTATVSGARLEVARRRKEARYPELAGDRGGARFVVLAGEVGGRFSHEIALWHQQKSGNSHSCCKVELTRRGFDGGVLCWRVPQLVLLHFCF